MAELRRVRLWPFRAMATGDVTIIAGRSVIQATDALWKQTKKHPDIYAERSYSFAGVPGGVQITCLRGEPIDGYAPLNGSQIIVSVRSSNKCPEVHYANRKGLPSPEPRNEIADVLRLREQWYDQRCSARQVVDHWAARGYSEEWVWDVVYYRIHRTVWRWSNAGGE